MQILPGTNAAHLNAPGAGAERGVTEQKLHGIWCPVAIRVGGLGSLVIVFKVTDGLAAGGYQPQAAHRRWQARWHCQLPGYRKAGEGADSADRVKDLPGD